MKIFQKILPFLASLVGRLPKTAAPATPAAPDDVAMEDVQKAIDLVNNVKSALASPVAMLITAVIPTNIDEAIRVTLVNELPVIAAGLGFVKAELSVDKSTALNQVLTAVRFSDKPNLDAFYHALGARVLQLISGGVSWSKAVLAIEYVLKEAILIPVAEPAAVAVAAPVETAAPDGVQANPIV